MAKRRTLKRKVETLASKCRELEDVCWQLKSSNRILKEKLEASSKMENALHLFANENSTEAMKIYKELFPNVIGQMM